MSVLVANGLTQWYGSDQDAHRSAGSSAGVLINGHRMKGPAANSSRVATTIAITLAPAR